MASTMPFPRSRWRQTCTGIKRLNALSSNTLRRLFLPSRTICDAERESSQHPRPAPLPQLEYLTQERSRWRSRIGAASNMRLSRRQLLAARLVRDAALSVDRRQLVESPSIANESQNPQRRQRERGRFGDLRAREREGVVQVESGGPRIEVSVTDRPKADGAVAPQPLRVSDGGCRRVVLEDRDPVGAGGQHHGQWSRVPRTTAPRRSPGRLATR